MSNTRHPNPSLPGLCRRLTPRPGLVVITGLTLLIGAIPALAATDAPWVSSSETLMQAFTGPIARGLSLVAIVIGGLLFAFDDSGSKKTLAGIIFGVGMAIGAVNFMNWLFPVA